MAGRIHQLFGAELAGRIHRAARDAGESEPSFVRRTVDEALAGKPAEGGASDRSRMRFAQGVLVGVLAQFAAMLLLG